MFLFPSQRDPAEQKLFRDFALENVQGSLLPSLPLYGGVRISSEHSQIKSLKENRKF